VVILPHPNQSTLFGLVLGLAKLNPNPPMYTPTNNLLPTSYNLIGRASSKPIIPMKKARQQS